MQIDNLIINAELIDVLIELREQLKINNIMLLNDIKDSGNNIMITCPYHKNGQERKPSAGLLKEDGVFHCFTCGETHSLQEVISNCFGYNDYGVFGTQWLIRNFATVSVEERKEIKLDCNRSNNIVSNSSVSADKRQSEIISEEELDSYRYYHPYMYKRKLNDEVIETFDIGYDANSKCITFPVRDVYGNCLFVARRSVDTKYFNYPSGAKKPIYGVYELYKLSAFPNEVIICESMLDALYFWTIGKYAVALNGLGSEEQYKELNKLPCRKFILCTDNDSAGMNARKVLRRKITNKLVTEYLLPSNVKDANDCSIEELKNLEEVF